MSGVVTLLRSIIYVMIVSPFSAVCIELQWLLFCTHCQTLPSFIRIAITSMYYYIFKLT